MNIQQLRYTIEVAQSGSITAAAKNLYMGQPNLSKSIKELESEIGIRLFRRTARGVAPTPDGEKFLACAKKVLAQMDILENTFMPQETSGADLSVAVSGVGYASLAFSRYLSSEKALPIRMQYREEEISCVFDDIASGFADIGIVRCPVNDNDSEIYMRRNRIAYRVLWDFTATLLMDEHHPLADVPEISVSMLHDYPEIICNEPSVSLAERRSPLMARQSRIMVSDRSILTDILHNVSGSYCWTVPMNPEIPKKFHMIQRPCIGAMQLNDLMIGRLGKPTEPESGFVRALRAEIERLKP